MNILLLFGNNPLRHSGAVSLDLFNEFKKRGHNVKMLVNDYYKNYPEGVISMETFLLSYKNRIVNKLRRILKLKHRVPTDEKYHFHTIDERKVLYRTKRILRKSKMKPDAIIVFFAKDFINAKNIYELNAKTKAPVYWMFYDSAPLTGGCHYFWDCTGYQNECGKCPGLFSSDPNDMTHQNLLYKKKYLDKTDIRIVVASEWQFVHAKKSFLFKDRTISKLFIAIDPNVFKPVSKENARPKLGIPNEKKVIFFGSSYIEQERKGMSYLISACRRLKKMIENTPLDSNVLLLVAGNGADKVINYFPFECRNLGVLNNNYGIAGAFQASDIFVCPSIEDAGPSMVNQSLMCGTPVVSFAQGVSLDLVITNKTGYRAKLKDEEDLAQGLYMILNLSNEEYCNMKNNCREMAMELLNPEINADKWLEMFGRK
jgi:glycosyltransferase involved in cell wall biosynthesis